MNVQRTTRSTAVRISTAAKLLVELSENEPLETTFLESIPLSSSVSAKLHPEAIETQMINDVSPPTGNRVHPGDLTYSRGN